MEDPEIMRLRRRQRRNFLATLFLSQGVPMLTAGDEFGRTQGGNNNAYCQDNEISWIDWSLAETEERPPRLRQRSCPSCGADHPVFQRRRFFSGREAEDGTRDIVWLTPAGEEMSASDWHTGYAKSLVVFLNGDAITEPGPRGEQIADDSFLLLINAHHEDMTFTLPGREIRQEVADRARHRGRDAEGPPVPDEFWPPEAAVTGDRTLHADPSLPQDPRASPDSATRLRTRSRR